MRQLKSTIIFSIMLRLKCQLDNLAEIYIILLVSNLYALLNYKSMIISNLGICLHIYFILVTRNVHLAVILHPKGGVTQNDFENLYRLSQIKI